MKVHTHTHMKQGRSEHQTQQPNIPKLRFVITKGYRPYDPSLPRRAGPKRLGGQGGRAAKPAMGGMRMSLQVYNSHQSYKHDYHGYAHAWHDRMMQIRKQEMIGIGRDT